MESLLHVTASHCKHKLCILCKLFSPLPHCCCSWMLVGAHEIASDQMRWLYSARLHVFCYILTSHSYIEKHARSAQRPDYSAFSHKSTSATFLLPINDCECSLPSSTHHIMACMALFQLRGAICHWYAYAKTVLICSRPGKLYSMFFDHNCVPLCFSATVAVYAFAHLSRRNSCWLLKARRIEFTVCWLTGQMQLVLTVVWLWLLMFALSAAQQLL